MYWIRQAVDSQIDKPQRGRPKRAELPDVNINTGVQSINTERASSNAKLKKKKRGPGEVGSRARDPGPTFLRIKNTLNSV